MFNLCNISLNRESVDGYSWVEWFEQKANNINKCKYIHMPRWRAEGLSLYARYIWLCVYIHIMCIPSLQYIESLSLSLYLSLYIYTYMLCFACFLLLCLLCLLCFTRSGMVSGSFRKRFRMVWDAFGTGWENCFTIRYAMFTSHTMCMLFTTYTMYTMHVLIVHNVWIGQYIHAMCTLWTITMHAYTMYTWHSMYNTVYTIYSRSHCIHRIESSKAAWSG